MANQPIVFKAHKKTFFEHLTPTNSGIRTHLSIDKAVKEIIDFDSNDNLSIKIDKRIPHSNEGEYNEIPSLDNNFINKDKALLKKKLHGKTLLQVDEDNELTEDDITITQADLVACLCYFFYEFREGDKSNYQYQTIENLEEFFKNLTIANSADTFDKHRDNINAFLQLLKKCSPFDEYHLSVDGKFNLLYNAKSDQSDNAPADTTLPNLLGSAVSYRDVKGYLSIGDYVSAINIFSSGADFNQLPFDKKIKILEIQQKYGLLEQVSEQIHALNEDERLESVQKGLLNLVALKYHSQRGEFTKVVELFSEIEELLSTTTHAVRLCSANFRVAFAHAHLNNQTACLEHFAKAEEIAKKENEGRLSHIIQMYRIMVSHFLGLGSFTNPFKDIEECQLKFFDDKQHVNTVIQHQENIIQIVNQAFFVECAMYLRISDIEKANIRLIMANALAYRVRFNPKAEGYAELLSLFNNNPARDTLLKAMSPSDKEREQFQETIPSVTTYLRKLQGTIIAFYQEPKKLNWQKLRTVLNEFDRD